MSTLQLQEIQKTLLLLNLKDLTKFVSEILLQKTNTISPKKIKKNQKITWENCNSPLREMTKEEAKIIDEFEKNPQIVTQEEVLELEKKLGIKLLFN